MAYIWNMAVEPGSEQLANEFMSRFNLNAMHVGDQVISFRLEKRFEQGGDGESWWCVEVTPYYGAVDEHKAVSASGGTMSVEHAKLLSTIGFELYRRLLGLPVELAITGWECACFYGFGNHAELVKDDLLITTDPIADVFGGLVVSQAVWETINKCTAFQAREDGTRWIPWQGEKHSDK